MIDVNNIKSLKIDEDYSAVLKRLEITIDAPIHRLSEI